MKLLSTIVFIFALSPLAHADMKADHDAIVKMAGCYEVTYHFEETGTTDPNYPIKSKIYNEHGLEWISVDNDKGNSLSLQHILLTPEGPLKHWRQQWDYQPTKSLQFKGDATWKTETLKTADVAGKWIQSVMQVDDSPRYSCVAAFQKDAKGQDFWECETYAPLPRREFTQRNDYNVIGRGNRHTMTKDGWMHDQNNKKLVVDVKTGAAKQIATEKGADTYIKVDDARCLDSQNYWKEHSKAWFAIQDMWAHMTDHHPNFTLKSKVGGEYLWEAMYELEEGAMAGGVGKLDVDALQEAVHELVHQYMVVLP